MLSFINKQHSGCSVSIYWTDKCLQCPRLRTRPWGTDVNKVLIGPGQNSEMVLLWLGIMWGWITTSNTANIPIVREEIPDRITNPLYPFLALLIKWYQNINIMWPWHIDFSHGCQPSVKFLPLYLILSHIRRITSTLFFCELEAIIVSTHKQGSVARNMDAWEWGEGSCRHFYNLL